MAHHIEQPWDRVLSVEGTEWHGLAEQMDAIGTEEVKPLLFDIVESPCFVKIDDEDTYLEDYKVLVADHRKCRSDLRANDQIVPLHIPKNGYKVIDNREIWETMEKALKDLDCKVTTAGTLERGKKFFISADIGSSEQVINKDRFRSYVNFITSHDGTMAMETFDSCIRIVCMNTFQASRGAAGDTKFKVYHTKNAAFALDGLSDLLQAILKGRVQTKEVLEYLATCKVDANDALAMASGYFCTATDSVQLSTRAWNAASDIATLFSRGIGNAGKSLYDLANGATEYWTSGNGTGKANTTLGQRTYRSALGQAAEHKVRFIEMLANEEARNHALRIGKDAVSLALKK